MPFTKRKFEKLGALIALGLAIASPAAAQLRLDPSTGAAGTLHVMSWRDIPFRTVVRQQYDFSCGSAALATLLTYNYGQHVSETEAFQAMYAQGDQAKIRRLGFSLLDMKHYLDRRGVRSDGFRMTLDDLARGHAPAIALIVIGRYRHFVVIKGVLADSVLVGDPAQGLKTYKRAEFMKLWNGVVFMLDPSPALHPVFNAAADWNPWSRAPLGQAAFNPIAMAELSRNLAPIYQLTPTLLAPGAPAMGGVP